LVETLDEVDQRFLRDVINLGNVYTSSSLLLDGNEMANKPIYQILEATDGPWW